MKTPYNTTLILLAITLFSGCENTAIKEDASAAESITSSQVQLTETATQVTTEDNQARPK